MSGLLQIMPDLEKDVERLHERLQFDPGGSDKIDEAVITAAEERAMIVAWLTKRYENTSYLEVVRIVTKQFAEKIERGEHWPKDKGTL